jgi:DNA-binding winged helix-turn-helix (wHTH) protein
MTNKTKKEVVIDRERGRTLINGVEVSLPHRELQIISAFAEAPGKVLSRELLLSTVWKGDYSGVATRTVDQHIARLRRRLGPRKDELIVTLPLLGYRGEGIRFAQPVREKIFCGGCQQEIKRALDVLKAKNWKP